MSVEDITVLLNQILKFDSQNCSESIDSNTTMANREVNVTLLKLDLDSINVYDGSAHTLNIFLNSSERLFRKYANRDNPADPINDTLFNAVLGKLRDRALLLVGNRTEIETWEVLKRTLISTFADQRSVECLIQDLLVLKPFKNETTFNFGQRCQDTRELIRAKVNLSPFSAPEKIIMNKTYDDLALKTFIRHIPSQIQMMVRMKDPKSIEDALAIVIEEENFKYSQNISNSLNVAQRSNPIRKVTPGNYLFRPPLQPMPQQYSQAQSFSQNYHAQPSTSQPVPFPRNPINIQPVYKPQKFFTNAQVFGKPKPTQTPNNNQSVRANPNQYRPTPMSVSSIKSTKRNFSHFPRQQNYFTPTARPNWVAEELNHADQEIDEPQDEQVELFEQMTDETIDEDPQNFVPEDDQSNFYLTDQDDNKT